MFKRIRWVDVTWLFSLCIIYCWFNHKYCSFNHIHCWIKFKNCWFNNNYGRLKRPDFSNKQYWYFQFARFPANPNSHAPSIRKKSSSSNISSEAFNKMWTLKLGFPGEKKWCGKWYFLLGASMLTKVALTFISEFPRYSQRLYSLHQNRRWLHWETWDTRVPDYWWTPRCRNQRKWAYLRIAHQPQSNSGCTGRRGVSYWTDSRQQRGAVKCYKLKRHYAFSCLPLFLAAPPLRVHVEREFSVISLSVGMS